MGYRSLSIRTPAALAMAFSAIEVFPKECMGGLLAQGQSPTIVASVPYQVAKRSPDSVETFSSPMLSNMRLGNLYKIGDFHSHPFSGRRNSEPLLPSEFDFEASEEGELDLIMRVIRVRAKKRRPLKQNGMSLSMAEGQFRILIRAFYRTEKYYSQVKIKLV